MNNFVVVKAFQDKETGTRYEIGQSYTPSNEERQRVLERGGYIAHETSQAAQEANQTANQAANQSNTEANQQGQQNAEAVTVLNGKVVSLEQARQATQAAEAQNTQTGIQAHHSNHSEAVPAGQVAKQSSAQTQKSTQTIRQANVQSGMNPTPAEAQSETLHPEATNAAQSSQAAANSSQAAQAGKTTKASVKKD